MNVPTLKAVLYCAESVSLAMLIDIMIRNVLLRVVMLSVGTLRIIIFRVFMLCVVLQSVFMVSIICPPRRSAQRHSA